MSSDEEVPRISPEEFLEESVKLLDEAKESGLILKIIGGTAVRLHMSQKGLDLLNRLGRELKIELDLVGLSKQKGDIRKFFERKGWAFDSYMFYFTMSTTVRNRYIFRGEKFDIDVFFDELDMCHKIDLRRRLELDHPTISLSDLLLSKLQIVDFTKKGAIDTVAILLDHEIGEEEVLREALFKLSISS